MLRLDRPLTASFGLALGTFAHAVGWPMVRGGAQAVADALVAELEALGGEVVTDHRVDDLRDLPPHRVAILDVTPRQLLAIAGHRLPGLARRRYEAFRYGNGVFKVDWALDGPVPWAAESVGRAGTVHLGGTLEEIAAAEAEVAAGRHPDRPYRAVRPVRPLGPVAGPRRQADRLGVLPRAGGLDGRHDRRHRVPG